MNVLSSVHVFLLMMAASGLGSTAAIGQHSPFADVEELCAQFNPEFSAVIDDFAARGWQRSQPDANDHILDLAFLATLYRLDPGPTIKQDKFIEEFERSKQRALQELGLDLPQKVLLTYPDREDVSPLILAFEKTENNAVKSSFRTSCNIAGSIDAEAVWLDALSEDGKLHDAFVDFDPSTLNFVGATPSAANIPDIKIEASGLLKYSRQRVEQALPRPMPYDLFYSIVTLHFRQG